MKVIIQQSLKRLGHPKELLNDLIDVATNGDMAMNKVIEIYTSEEYKQQYSLIIMDCQMPQMDGYEATQEIRKFINRAKRQQPQIIACTGNVEESMIQKAWRSQMDEIVSKPASVEIVSEILKEVLEVL